MHAKQNSVLEREPPLKTIGKTIVFARSVLPVSKAQYVLERCVKKNINGNFNVHGWSNLIAGHVICMLI